MTSIDKKIPIPRVVRERFKYPWKTMEIGDSFVAGSHMPTQASRASSKYSRRFVVRREGPRRWRVWRTQ